MTLQVLVSTMNQTDYSLIEKMNIQSDTVVVNQCDRESKEELELNGIKVLWINSKERGLSCSRNLAIQNATADICLLADDDLVYREGFKSRITDAFLTHPEYSIIRFKVEGIEEKFKEYPTKTIKIGYRRAFNISSVEMAFKREDLVDKKILFDELIGAGTEFLMGEENALIIHCLKAGLKAVYIPQIIADLHIGDSSWFSGYNEEYFIGRGAAFAAMETCITHPLILQFAVRKYKLYKNSCSFWKAIKMMFYGKSKYIRMKRGKM